MLFQGLIVIAKVLIVKKKDFNEIQKSKQTRQTKSNFMKYEPIKKCIWSKNCKTMGKKLLTEYRNLHTA